MKLTQLVIQNFLSFGDCKVSFVNSNSPILIEGNNLDKEGSNGAGKSALLEALYWSITGDTIRKIKAGRVIRQGQKQCKVIATIVIDDKELIIERSYSSSSKTMRWSLAGKQKEFHDMKQATEALLKELGTTDEQLSLTCFFGNNFISFGNKTPRERAELIDKLVAGERWDKARKVASKQRKQSKERFETLLIQIEGVETIIDETKQEISNLKDKLQDKKRKDKDDRQRISERLDELDEDEKEVDIRISKIAKRDEKYKNKYDEVKTMLNQNRSEIADLLKEIDRKQDNLNELKLMLTDDYTCPTCGQEVTMDKERRTEIEDKITLGTQCIQKKQKAISQLEARQDELDDIQDDLETKLDEIEKKIKKVNADKMAINNEQIKLKTILASDQDDGITILTDEIEKKKQKIVKYKSSIDEYNRQRDNMEFYIDVYAKWEEAFQQKRFNDFQVAVNLFSQELVRYCDRQGLDFDDIEVTTEKELASGKIVPHVAISINRDGKEMDIDAMSDGERQRIGLASFLTMKTLMNSSSKSNFEIAILDEPLSCMDEEGKVKVFNMLKDECDDGRQVIMTDHQSSFKDLFSQVITVTKENRITRV